MRAVVERLAPARLGTPFRWLLASSWTSNLGDGLALSAGPLLVAARTQDPFLVALAVLLQRLPWVLFGLAAGKREEQVDHHVPARGMQVGQRAFGGDVGRDRDARKTTVQPSHEAGGALGVSILAIAAPILGVLFALLLVFVAGRALARRRLRR